jgi:hypothetical protein
MSAITSIRVLLERLELIDPIPEREGYRSHAA